MCNLGQVVGETCPLAAAAVAAAPVPPPIYLPCPALLGAAPHPRQRVQLCKAF